MAVIILCAYRFSHLFNKLLFALRLQVSCHCDKHQFIALLRKADKHMILSEEEHIAPGHAVFVETVNANPCWLPFDQSGDGRFPVAKHHFAVI